MQSTERERYDRMKSGDCPSSFPKHSSSNAESLNDQSHHLIVSGHHRQEVKQLEKQKDFCQVLPRLDRCVVLSVESILISTTSTLSTRLSMTNLPRQVRLVVYSLGIFFCYFFFGIFQEKMWVHSIFPCNLNFSNDLSLSFKIQNSIKVWSWRGNVQVCDVPHLCSVCHQHVICKMHSLGLSV